MEVLNEIMRDVIWAIVRIILFLLLISAGFGGAFYGIRAIIYGVASKAERSGSKEVKRKKFKYRHVPFSKRVRLKDSALFMACLEKIKEGKLTSLYVNPYMACFNFTPPYIAEKDMIDFQKCGFLQIPEDSVQQYMVQLAFAAKWISHVKHVRLEMHEFHPQPYLIYGGYYNCGSAAESCPMLFITYDQKKRKP